MATHRPSPKQPNNTAYERWRRRQIAYGRWHPHTSPDAARAHLLWLRETYGIGRVTAARLAGVHPSTIRRIVGRHTRLITTTVEQRILAIHGDNTPYLVDATGTRRRLQALIATGWTQLQLAERIGWKVQNLNKIVQGSRRLVTPQTEHLIRNAYRDVRREPLPVGRGANRARALAGRNGWLTPAEWDAWGDIDDPDHTSAGPLVDEVAVTRALAGDETAAQRLSREERRAAVRQGIANGMTPTAVAGLLGMAHRTVYQYADQTTAEVAA